MVDEQADAAFATTIDRGEIVAICCNGPLMLLHQVVSARIIRRGKIDEFRGERQAPAP